MSTADQYAGFVEGMEQSLARAVGSLEQPLLSSAAGHLCLGQGGKRVRPRLVWAFAHCLPRVPAADALIDVAVAGEMIHSGSLLHDDVVDQGTTRRNRPTVNVVWGNTVAVLAGDLLLTQALAQVSRHTPQLTADAVATIAAMTRAAMAEVEARGKIDLSEADWREIANGKTGTLFSWCGRGAAHLAADAHAVECFDRCGLGLGVAFQLADDLLDLIGERTGKDRYSDLRNQEASLPILIAAAASAELRAEVQTLWSDGCPEERVTALGDRIARSAAVQRCLELLDAEIRQALEVLDGYRDTPGGALIQTWAEKQLRQRLGR